MQDLENNLEEIWKPLNGIVEFGENYEVSNLGNVRSIDRIVNSISGGRTVKGKMLKFWYDKDDYARATLQFDGKKKHYGVHRLVALAFIGNIHNKPTVNHKDGNKQNNYIGNLEWSTHKEQIIHADKGLRKMPNGENWHNTKLTENDVREIFSLCKTGRYTHKELSEMYNVSRGAIDGIIYKKSWKHLNLE